MPTTPLLSVYDGNHHCLRSYHSGLRELRTNEGEPSGMLFNSIRSFTALQRQFVPTHTLFTFDHGRSAYRLAISSTYKANRDKDKKTDGGGDFDLKPQFEAFQEFLDIVGVPYIRVKNVEADDLVASVVKEFDGQLSIVVISGDHDLRQLVTDSSLVFRPGSPEKGIEGVWYTVGSIMKEYGLPPHRLPEIWALEGDSTDNIKGIPRVGPVTAKKFILKYGSLQNTLAQEPKCAGWERVAWDAYRMIVLDGSLHTVTHTLDDLQFTPEFPVEKLREFLLKWEFHSLVDKLLLHAFWS